MHLLLLAAAEAAPDPMEHVLPHAIFGHAINNHHVMALVVLVVGIAMLWYVAKRMPVTGEKAEDFVTRGAVPQLFETILIFFREEVTRPLLGDLTDKYIKYVWSTFFFILFGNLLGMIPTAAVGNRINHYFFGGHQHWMGELGGTITGNVNVTGGLACISLFMIVFVGLKENGFGFIKHMWAVPCSPPEGVKGPMLLLVMPILWFAAIVVFILELVGYVIKSFALCMRLFANMVAGHLVLGSLVIMAMSAPMVGKGASILGAAVFSFLELFVAFLQAYIFTFLTVIFISLGAVSHHEHDEHHGGLDEGALPGDALAEKLTETKTVSPAH